jgi:hypothetical protein
MDLISGISGGHEDMAKARRTILQSTLHLKKSAGMDVPWWPLPRTKAGI